MYTQEKINTALGLLSLMTNELNMLNCQMCLIKSDNPLSDQFQKERELSHVDFANRIIELTNDLGDYFNDLDAVDESFLKRVNPQFEFINEEI